MSTSKVSESKSAFHLTWKLVVGGRNDVTPDLTAFQSENRFWTDYRLLAFVNNTSSSTIHGLWPMLDIHLYIVFTISLIEQHRTVFVSSFRNIANDNWLFYTPYVSGFWIVG